MGPKEDWRVELARGLRGLAGVLEETDKGNALERTLGTLGRVRSALHDPNHPVGQFAVLLTGDPEDEGEDSTEED